MPWRVYEVRRVIRPRAGDPTRAANASRSLRAVAAGIRAQMAAVLRKMAEAEGAGVDDEDGIERAWLRRRGAAFPAAEHFLVAGPAGPQDKDGPGFEVAWQAATAQAPGPSHPSGSSCSPHLDSCSLTARGRQGPRRSSSRAAARARRAMPAPGRILDGPGPLPRSSGRPEAYAVLLPRRAQGQLVRIAPGLVRARTGPCPGPGGWSRTSPRSRSAPPERRARAGPAPRATIRQPDRAERDTVRADTVRRPARPSSLWTLMPARRRRRAGRSADACGGELRTAHPPRTRGVGLPRARRRTLRCRGGSPGWGPLL